MRQSPRNLGLACDHKGPTHFGGIHFFHEFVRVLQPPQTSGRDFPDRPKRTLYSQALYSLISSSEQCCSLGSGWQ
jgi:hypothetical protein